MRRAWRRGALAAIALIGPACNDLAGIDPVATACGNGVVDSGEECDDGNLDDSDACPSTCENARCGDGFVQAGVEACDRGGEDGSDDCLSWCGAPPGGESCPGAFVSVALEAPIVLRGATRGEGDDVDVTGCGVEGAEDVVYAVSAQWTGRLHVTPQEGFDEHAFDVRGACDDSSSSLACGTGSLLVPVSQGSVVYLTVDDLEPASEGRYEVQLTLDGCGDGYADTGDGEGCDDGNLVDGDGCDACIVKCEPFQSNFGEALTYEDPTTHHCYWLVTGGFAAWPDAYDECSRHGAFLAALSTVDEISAVGPLLSNSPDAVWLGGYQFDVDYFLWNSNEAWFYQNGQPPWLSGEPSAGPEEACLEISPSGSLNDAQCTTPRPFLCERWPAGVPF